RRDGLRHPGARRRHPPRLLVRDAGRVVEGGGGGAGRVGSGGDLAARRGAAGGEDAESAATDGRTDRPAARGAGGRGLVKGCRLLRTGSAIRTIERTRATPRRHEDTTPHTRLRQGR